MLEAENINPKSYTAHCVVTKDYITAGEDQRRLISRKAKQKKLMDADGDFYFDSANEVEHSAAGKIRRLLGGTDRRFLSVKFLLIKFWMLTRSHFFAF